VNTAEANTAIVNRAWRFRRRRAAWTYRAYFVAGLVIIASLDHDSRLLAGPILALAALSVYLVMTLWVRDGEVPLFETGTLFALAVSAYGMLALWGFLLMHGQWDPLSDNRLQWYSYDAGELAALGWRCVVYLTAFVCVYLLVRGRVRAARRLTPPSGSTVAAIVTLFVGLWILTLVLRFGYGFGTISYENLDQVNAAMQAVPYIVRQLGHNIVSALLIAEQGILILLLLFWRRIASRVVVIAWLSGDVALAFIHLGSRTGTVLLILSAALVYHRLVRPLSFPVVLAGGGALLMGFLFAGYIRSVSGEWNPRRLLTAANEFQAIFANAFDLLQRREQGTLPAVPWQIYAADFYMPIPSQFLPFEKIEPASWYAGVLGAGNSGVGFMFGVMAQAAVGWDWVELVLRGAALGVVFALLHRWYVRHSASLWPTLFYLFLGVCIYYTFRATSFWFVYFIVYQFLPVFIVAKILELSLKRVLTRA